MAAAGEVTPRVLIAGYGDLGGKVGETLAGQGMEIIGLCRSPRSQMAPARLIACDVGAPATLQGLEALSPDILLYCVAADAPSEASYRRHYVDGLKNVLHALVNAPLKHVFFVSSTRVYGQATDNLLDEDTPAIPADFGGECLLQGEQEALAHGVPASILRLSGIYGPGRLRMLRLAQQSPNIWPANSWTNRIHRDDAAGFIVHLINQVLQGKELSSHYLVTDSTPASMHEVLNWLARTMKMPHQSAMEVPQHPVGRTVNGGKRLDNRLLRASGYALAYPSYLEGYAALLAGNGLDDGRE